MNHVVTMAHSKLRTFRLGERNSQLKTLISHAVFLLLSACAPVGKPLDTPACPKLEEKPEPAHTSKAYFDCGKQIACGIWCTPSKECLEIKNEMEGEEANGSR